MRKENKYSFCINEKIFSKIIVRAVYTFPAIKNNSVKVNITNHNSIKHFNINLKFNEDIINIFNSLNELQRIIDKDIQIYHTKNNHNYQINIFAN